MPFHNYYKHFTGTVFPEIPDQKCFHRQISIAEYHAISIKGSLLLPCLEQIPQGQSRKEQQW